MEEHIEEIRKLSMDTRIFLPILLDQYEILENGQMEVKEMCQAWDGAMMMYYDEGVSYGISHGIQETRRKNILRMLSKKKYSYEEISEINDATIEEVKELEMQLC